MAYAQRMSDPSEDLVYLSNGPVHHGDIEYYDGELVPRSQVPDYAVRGGEVDGGGVDGGVAGRKYEERVIENWPASGD